MTNDPLAAMKISLAYKATVLAMALAQANQVAQQLNLPCQKPIEHSDLKWAYVSPPGLSKPLLPSVSFDTKDFAYSFTDGKLHVIHGFAYSNWDMEHYHQWVKMRSLVDSNAAYQLAAQWLSTVSVNVPALNRNYPLTVGQPFFWADPSSATNTNRVTLPIYQVKWGNPGDPAVAVEIFGPTKELMDLHVEDQSFSTRTNLFLTNSAELNNIPDPPKKTLLHTNVPQVFHSSRSTSPLQPGDQQLALEDQFLGQVGVELKE
jgi:hypothetical protein